MPRSQQDNERLTELVQKLFGAWARKASVEELLGYATGLRELSLQQIELAIDKAIDAGVGEKFPPNAATLKTMAPSIAALNEPEQRRDCMTCLGTGYKLVEFSGVRKAVLCDCVNDETRAKIEEWLGRKAST